MRTPAFLWSLVVSTSYQQREVKYAARRWTEPRSREAIRTGMKVYDQQSR